MNLAVPARSPLLKKAHVQARLKFASEHLNDSEKAWEKGLWSDGTKVELFGINSTCLGWRMKKCAWNQRTSFPWSSMEMETCFEAVE